MKRRLLGTVVIAVVFISTVAFAQNDAPKRSSGNRGDMQLQRNRDLIPRGERVEFFTEEQQETIKKIRLETGKEVKPLQNKLNEMEARQHTLTTADKTDMNAINKNIEEMGKIKIEIAKIQAKQQQETRKLLTEEQLARFDNRRERSLDVKRGNSGMNQMNRPGRNGRPPFERGK